MSDFLEYYFGKKWKLKYLQLSVLLGASPSELNWWLDNFLIEKKHLNLNLSMTPK